MIGTLRQLPNAVTWAIAFFWRATSRCLTAFAVRIVRLIGHTNQALTSVSPETCDAHGMASRVVGT